MAILLVDLIYGVYLLNIEHCFIQLTQCNVILVDYYAPFTVILIVMMGTPFVST